MRAADQLVVASVFVNASDVFHHSAGAVLAFVIDGLRAQCRGQLLGVGGEGGGDEGKGGASDEGKAGGGVAMDGEAEKERASKDDVDVLVSDLSQEMQFVLERGRSLFVVLDGIPASVAPLVATAVLHAHKYALLSAHAAHPTADDLRGSATIEGRVGQGELVGSKTWPGCARVQCMITVDWIPTELERYLGLLATNYSLPPLSGGEQRAIRQVWEKNLQERPARPRALSGGAGASSVERTHKRTGASVGLVQGGQVDWGALSAKNSSPLDIVLGVVLRHAHDRRLVGNKSEGVEGRARGDAWESLLDVVEGMVGNARMGALAAAALASVQKGDGRGV